MKKWTSLLAIFCVLALAACGDDEENNVTVGSNNTSNNATTNNATTNNATTNNATTNNATTPTARPSACRESRNRAPGSVAASAPS